VAVENFQSVAGGASYTVAAGSNRIVVIALCRETATGSNQQVTSLSLGSSSLANGRITQAVTADKNAASPRGRAYIWYIPEAYIQSGAQTLAATWSNTMADANDLFACWTLTGRAQTNPVDNTGSLTVDTVLDPWPLSVTAAANADMVMAAWNSANTRMTPATGWTEDHDADTVNSALWYGHYEAAPAGTIDCTLDQTTTRQGSMCVASFKVAPSSTPPSVAAESTTSNTGNAQNHTFSIPTPVAGDRIVAFLACDANSATDIAWPVGWTELLEQSNGVGVRLSAAYRDCTGAEGASIVVSIAGGNEKIAGHAWRISTGTFDPGRAPIIAGAGNNLAQSNQPDPPNVAMGGTGDHLYLTMYGADIGTNVATAYPSGYSNTGTASSPESGGIAVGWARKSSTASSSDNPAAFTMAGTEQWCAFTIGVAPVGSLVAVNLDSIAADLVEGTAKTVTGTNFGATQGAGTLVWGGVTQTPTAWGDTSITFTPTVGVNLYGVDQDLVVTNNSALASNAASVAMVPPATEYYFDLSQELIDAQYRLTATPDIVEGGQVHVRSVSGGAITDVTVFQNASFETDAAVTSFQARANNNDGEGWGAWATQTLGSAVTAVLNANQSVM
jgi:hypothetical protein